MGSSEIRAALPEKGFWRQVGDGINSWFDGAGWYLTMLMAKSGSLGPEIGAQSREIERTMAAGILAINSNREQARAAASAVFQEYPWPSGARFGTGAFMGRGGKIGTGSGVLLGTAVAQGSMAHHAFRAGEAGVSPESMMLAAVAGEVCR